MSPLLYIIFNRPSQTRISFEKIRALRPPKLYIAADAPREGHATDAERTEQARAVTDTIDWDCEVHRLYADSNMGCGRRISSAISTVLNDSETVIVLEDDCIPDPTFFPYCEQLLDTYASDQRVMAVSGDNFQQGISRTRSSYYFSKYPHCWGWATWRRAWQHFDLEMPWWPDFRDSGELRAFCENDRELAYWTWIMDQVYEKKIDSWAMPWTLCCWLQSGLTVLPSVNLVSNVGFDGDGTNTLQRSAYAELPTDSINRIEHPSHMYRHVVADQFTDELLYSGPWQRSHRKKQRGVKRLLRWTQRNRSAA